MIKSKNNIITMKGKDEEVLVDYLGILSNIGDVLKSFDDNIIDAIDKEIVNDVRQIIKDSITLSEKAKDLEQKINM